MVKQTERVSSAVPRGLALASVRGTQIERVADRKIHNLDARIHPAKDYDLRHVL